MKKFMAEIVKRAIEKHFFDTTCFKVTFEKAEKYQVYFTAETIYFFDEDAHEYPTYWGYIGSVGQIVILKRNGEWLDEFINLF